VSRGTKNQEILEKQRFFKISVDKKNVHRLFITPDLSKIFTKMLCQKIFVIQISYIYIDNNFCNSGQIDIVNNPLQLHFDFGNILA